MKFFDRIFKGNAQETQTQAIPSAYSNALEKLARQASENKEIAEYLRYPYSFTAQEGMMGYALDEAAGYLCKVYKKQASAAPEIRKLPLEGSVTDYHQRLFHQKGDKVWFGVTTIKFPQEIKEDVHKAFAGLTKKWMFAPVNERILLPSSEQAAPKDVSFLPMPASAPLVTGPYAQAHRLDEISLWSFNFKLDNRTVRCFKLFARKENRIYVVDSYAPGSQSLSFYDYSTCALMMGSFFPIEIVSE